MLIEMMFFNMFFLKLACLIDESFDVFGLAFGYLSTFFVSPKI